MSDLQIIDGPGNYITEGGRVAKVESWDGHRRAFGADPDGLDISWYLTGQVRDGTVTGNRLVMKDECGVGDF